MLRSTLRVALASVAAAALALTAIATGPALAHDGPKPGSRCAMSGLIKISHKTVHICQRSGIDRPRWSQPLGTSASPVTVADGWIKAADSGMTAGFGTVTNPTSKPVRIIGAYSALSFAIQLHETVMADAGMVMQEKAGGFLIPAQGTFPLEPGANHLMLMNLERAVMPGSVIRVTLVTSTGGLIRTTLLAKVFPGAVEDYEDGVS